MRLADVAEEIAGLDEVVARVEVAVVLERDRVAARLGEDAHGRRQVAPGGERGVEHLHEHRADVTAHPLVEDVDEESTPAPGSTDRSVTVSPSWNPVSLSRSTIGMSWMCRAPRSSRKNRYTSSGRSWFAALTVHRTLLRRRGGGAARPSHDAVEGGTAPLVDAVRVVQLPGPSMLIPTRKSCSARNSHHSSVSNVPLVWIVWWMASPGGGARSRSRGRGGRSRRP